MTHQTSLFPLTVRTTLPAPGGADIAAKVRASDGRSYYLKDIKDDPVLPATEWICCRLAEAAGIPVPAIAVITLEDGSRAFGSRHEGGIADKGTQTRIAFGEVRPAVLGSSLSMIYAFDLFVANADRRLDNLLFIEDRAIRGADRWSPVAIDFSRALFRAGWPLPAPPLPKDSDTRLMMEGFWQSYRPDSAAAERALDAILAIPVARVELFMTEMPEEWREPCQCDKLLEWWIAPGGMASRVQTVRGGLRDGSCF